MGQKDDMDMQEVLSNIFGPGVLAAVEKLATNTGKTASGHTRVTQYLGMANDYMKTVLTEHVNPPSNTEDNRHGRIGPKFARFDVFTHHGQFILSPDRLSLNSQSNFSTMRANVAVFGGKWIYEIQLGSKGIMQVGWGTAQCKFSPVSGVGDTPNSYAYDGNRVRRWNVSTHKYGEPWLSGDIIGCTLDLDNGVIEFYRNGKSLGRAFEGVSTGAGIAYFPTVSLAFKESLTANFGSTPLRYPVEGFETFQAAPTDQINQAIIICEWLKKVIRIIEAGKESLREENDEDSGSPAVNTISNNAFVGCIARAVVRNFGPLLASPYVVEAVFVPFLRELPVTSGSPAEGTDVSRVRICLDLLWAFLDDEEMKTCLDSTVIHLIFTFKHVSLRLDYPDQSKSLILLTNICQHTATRQYLLQHMLFSRVRFANFVHIKPLDESGLADVVGTTWWETDPLDSVIETNKEQYLMSCDRIKNAISEIEALQVELLVTLLDNTDGTPTTPSSRTIFLRKFRNFVQTNWISSRITAEVQTPLPITLCCFHRLLVAFRILWDAEIGSNPIYVPCRNFYDASINYAGIDRLGGVLSHLNKTFKAELLHHLGPEHEVIVAMEQTQEQPNAFSGGPSRFGELPIAIPALARMTTVNSTSPSNPMILERLLNIPFNREDQTPMRLGQADPSASLLELLDGIILFYHLTAKRQIAKVATLRESMDEYIAAMGAMKNYLEITRKQPKDSDAAAMAREITRVIEVFDIKLAEQARHMAWVRAVVYSREKQAHLVWLLRVVTLTLTSASEEGNMFSFVPKFYLEAMADLSVGIRSHVHPTAPIEDIPEHQEMLIDVAKFLCDHCLDSRIVHANAKDTLGLTLAGFVSNPLTLGPLENVPIQSRVKLVNSLLKPYENRAWAQSNWVLVRFWQGYGFAFRYEKSPHFAKKVGAKLMHQESISKPIKPCPSPIYQAHVKSALLGNSVATTQFLNSLLNQLNWAFSEFIGMLQEMQRISLRPQRVPIESRQLKICATCFDLAISLLRVLEMIATLATSVFTNDSQESSESLLARLFQLLCQILNRVSSQTGCFQYLVHLEIPDLETIDHFPILSAVIGILLVLLKEDMTAFKTRRRKMPKVTKALLDEPSFQIESLYFVLGEVKPKHQNMRNVKPFCFQYYKDDVSEQEIKNVREMLRYLEFYRALTETKLTSIDDDNICTICYAYPISAIFKPCNHRSCRACIAHHLLNSRQCFFCKANIDQVADMEGKLIHDLTADPTLEDLTVAS
ncbi:E3 ubiquitin-protein ligase RNF123-like isoform X2 [Athalia rosae]|uniref:E3 ubiquitin-protein ligase RNF123-like isoform X2 n=1 Tax=Athalia rosae TaxID=37344 RepID=UPI00203476A2|nr:E3 ubiquitin-protein ligase RNF123-like isoform X2 [Athalia rosae]